MLGGEDAQKAYQEAIVQIMHDTVEEVRAARRMPSSPAETDPVMLGNSGQAGGISSA